METKRELKQIRLELIVPDPDQPRTHFDEAKLDELALSMKEHGQRQPVEVEALSDGRYMLHHGERRWRAAQRVAGMETIEAIVAPPIADAQERLILGIVENVQRDDLNPIEEAKAYRRLEEMGMGHVAIARKVGRSQALVSGRLVWLDLPEEIQEMVARGDLQKDRRIADGLLSIGVREVQIKLARRSSGSGISIKQFVATCARVRKELEAARVQVDIAKVKAPMLALAINGNKPPEESKLRWETVRAQARTMCDACSLRDLTEGVPEPAWWLVQSMAEQTCAACDVRGDLQVCRECPGVDLIKRLVKAAKEA